MKKATTKRAVRREQTASSEGIGQYSMLLAYDVPCYGSIEFRSKSDAAAVRKAKAMLADWDNQLGGVSFMEEHGGADQHRVVSLTHVPTRRTVAEDLYMGQELRPKVLIHVQGGVADYYVDGAVDVALIDFDNIEAGDPPVELDESWREITKDGFFEEESKYFRFVTRK